MYKDLSGQRIEGTRLTAIRRAKDYVAPSGSRHAVWLCRCDCGNEVLVRRDHMFNGNWVSCGCKRAEDAKVRMREVGKRRWAARDATSSVASVRTGDTFPSRGRQDGGTV